jgi:hypothetical protein
VWGNILFGGLIGLVVDFASGGVYNIAPENVHVDLVANGTSAAPTP